MCRANRSNSCCARPPCIQGKQGATIWLSAWQRNSRGSQWHSCCTLQPAVNRFRTTWSTGNGAEKAGKPPAAALLQADCTPHRRTLSPWGVMCPNCCQAQLSPTAPRPAASHFQPIPFLTTGLACPGRCVLKCPMSAQSPEPQACRRAPQLLTTGLACPSCCLLSGWAAPQGLKARLVPFSTHSVQPTSFLPHHGFGLSQSLPPSLITNSIRRPGCRQARDARVRKTS